jgi:AcrR family transcriptional regulator
MPKISQHRRDARRQQILDAALACFSEEGFHQSGMAEIVQRSGLSRGAVYGYFSSKDDIIEALADDRHQRETLLNAAALQTGDPIDGLRRLVRAYGAWLNDPEETPGRRVGMHGWTEALRSDRVRALVVAGIDVPRGMIAELIERGQQSRQISQRLSADAVARLLIALFQGLVLQVSWGESIDIDACAIAVDHMLEGLTLADGRCLGAAKKGPET